MGSRSDPSRPRFGIIPSRLVTGGLGLVACLIGLSILAGAWNLALGYFIFFGLFSLPFLAVGAFFLMSVEEASHPTAGESLLIQPEGKMELFVHLGFYGWLGLCVLVFAKCLWAAVHPDALPVPLWGWIAPLSAIPVITRMRRRHAFLDRWGRCQLRLLQPAQLGKPFTGFLEAGTRFEPTQDFRFRLHYLIGDTDSLPKWIREQVVARDRMETTERGCRIPFHFETLYQACDPDSRHWPRWRLSFRTQLAGKTYTESFTAGLSEGTTDISLEPNATP